MGIISVVLTRVQGIEVALIDTLKVVAISFMAVATLVLIIFSLAIIGGLWIHKKKKDPNTFLIPVTTSIADFSSIIIFALLVAFLF
jgi:cation transporter-like permease